MTEEQKASYVNAMSIGAMIKALGMLADNQQRAQRGESLAWTGADFDALINVEGIHHNAVLQIFHEWPTT